MTKHKNESSLNSYIAGLTPGQQQDMSNILANAFTEQVHPMTFIDICQATNKTCYFVCYGGFIFIKFNSFYYHAKIVFVVSC